MEALRRVRAAKRLTQRELAEASGVNKNTISDIERGARKPHPITVGKLADALGVSMEELDTDPKAGAPESREESAFVITGRMVEGRYVMTVLWNVPPEERDKYRADLHRVLTNGFLEGEMTPERARKLVGTA